MQKSITLAAVQFHPTFGDTEDNLERMLTYVAETDADLIVFPELATSGYEFKDRQEVSKLALSPDDDQLAQIRETCQQKNRYVVLGFPEKSGDGVFNSSVLLHPDGSYHVYRKVHLFDRELSIFDKGDAEPFVVDTQVGKLGMMICFDWLFPEVARILSLKGAQILVHPSNLVLSFCQRAMFARSVENGVFSVTCNRIGTEERTDRALTFTGASQILSNKGETLASASPNREEVITAVIEPAAADQKMITEYNHRLGDRRPELYNRLHEK